MLNRLFDFIEFAHRTQYEAIESCIDNLLVEYLVLVNEYSVKRC